METGALAMSGATATAAVAASAEEAFSSLAPSSAPPSLHLALGRAEDVAVQRPAQLVHRRQPLRHRGAREGVAVRGRAVCVCGFRPGY